MTNKSSHPLSVQKLVNLLFLHIYKPDGKQYTNKEVGDSVGVSQSSLTRLRDGDQPNPTLSTIRALLSFFDVPIAYMDATTDEEAIKIIWDSKKKIDNAASVKLRNLDADLSPRSLNQISMLIQYALDVQEAKNNGEEPPPPPQFTPEYLEENEK